MSPRKKYTSKMIMLGLCIHYCGRPGTDNCGQCETCAEKNRVKNRNRYRRLHGIPLTQPMWKRKVSP